MDDISEARDTFWASFDKAYSDGSLNTGRTIQEQHKKTVDGILEGANAECTHALHRAWSSWSVIHQIRSQERDDILSLLLSTTWRWPLRTPADPSAESAPFVDPEDETSPVARRRTATNTFMSQLHKHSEAAFRGAAPVPPPPSGPSDAVLVSGAQDILNALASCVDEALPTASSDKLTAASVLTLVKDVSQGLERARNPKSDHNKVKDQLLALTRDLDSDDAATIFDRFSNQRSDRKRALIKRLRTAKGREDYPDALDAKDANFSTFPAAFNVHHHIYWPPKSEDFDIAQELARLKDTLSWNDATPVFNDLAAPVRATLSQQKAKALKEIKEDLPAQQKKLKEELETRARRARVDLPTKWAEDARQATDTALAEQEETHKEEMDRLIDDVNTAKAHAQAAETRVQEAQAALENCEKAEDEAEAAYDEAERRLEEITAQITQVTDPEEKARMSEQMDQIRRTSLNLMTQKTEAHVRTSDARDERRQAGLAKGEADDDVAKAEAAQRERKAEQDRERAALTTTLATSTEVEGKTLAEWLDDRTPALAKQAREELDNKHVELTKDARTALQEVDDEIEGTAADSERSLKDLETAIQAETDELNTELETATIAYATNVRDRYHEKLEELIANASFVLVIGFVIQHQPQSARDVYQKLTLFLRHPDGLEPRQLETDAERRALDEFLALGCAIRATDEDGRTRFYKDALLDFLDDQELEALDQNGPG